MYVRVFVFTSNNIRVKTSKDDIINICRILSWKLITLIISKDYKYIFILNGWCNKTIMKACNVDVKTIVNVFVYESPNQFDRSFPQYKSQRIGSFLSYKRISHRGWISLKPCSAANSDSILNPMKLSSRIIFQSNKKIIGKENRQIFFEMRFHGNSETSTADHEEGGGEECV